LEAELIGGAVSIIQTLFFVAFVTQTIWLVKWTGIIDTVYVAICIGAILTSAIGSIAVVISNSFI